MNILIPETAVEFIKYTKENENCIIDFYAEWCTPCNNIAEKFCQITELYPNIPIIKVNINILDNVANMFKVKKIPHFSFFKDNKLEDKYLQTSDINIILQEIKEIYE